jgi:hypothetical protein
VTAGGRKSLDFPRLPATFSAMTRSPAAATHHHHHEAPTGIVVIEACA